MPRKVMPDRMLLSIALILVSVGLVMVYSSSAIMAAERFGDSWFFAKRQLLWALVGLVALRLAMAVDYRRLDRLVWPLLVLSGVLLVLVLIPPFGQSINGTRRWLRVGGVSFQPVELVKLVFVIYLAAHLAKKGEAIRNFWGGLCPPVAIGALFAVLVVRQPDLGNSLALVLLLFTLLFLAGARSLHLAAVAAPAIVLLAIAVWIAPYRWRRILAFLNPEADPLGSGFQIIQSYLAIGAGGLFGRGLGDSKQKLFYLPEAHTDFIFSVLAEELGLIGAVAVILLFAALVWRGLRVGLRASDPFGAYLAFGITIMLATQTVVNLGVVTGLLPTKGLPLPFVSFGGTALVMTLLATGILLNVSRSAGLSPPRTARRAMSPAPPPPRPAFAPGSPGDV